MNFKLHNKVFFRIPQFPYNAKLEDCWDELKESIKIASPDFWLIIENVKVNELDQMKVRTRITVLKYFNRSKYRATPFGTFAGFGIADMEPTNKPLTISACPKVIRLIDWRETKQHTYDFEDLINENRKIFANSSYYFVADSIRYLNREGNSFELADIDNDILVLDVLKCSATPVPLNSMICELQSKYPEMSVAVIVEDMIGSGLLFTELDANIIGEEYFARIGAVDNKQKVGYVISKRDVLSGRLNTRLFRHLGALLTLLPQINTSQIPQDLKEFKTSFIRRFDKRTVPLMVALDPELGIGYGNLDVPANTEELIKDFIKAEPDGEDQQQAFNKFLLQHISGSSNAGVLRLEHLKLQQDVATMSPLSNTTSCIFSISDDLLIMDKIGGYSVNQLTGRFSAVSDELHSYCLEMAEIEKEANPDVIFFDVGYLAEPSIDNINRRKQIYDYELNILNFNAGGTPLLLSDIYINVSGQEIILRSKSLGKRVIPRMASAYNAVRSDLPLFRFMSDMMYHGICSGFSFHLPEIFPDIATYPRMQFHNIVLSPASWRLDKKIINLNDPDIALFHYLSQQKVSRFVRVGNGDETLCLDTQSREDCSILSKMLTQKNSLLLCEVILPGSGDTVDENLKPYFAQFILPLIHHETLYWGSAPVVDEAPVKSIFLPGSQWFSCEFYCHPNRMDQLLHNELSLFLREHAERIEKWFFVRYQENGDHLRLRLLLKDINDCGLFIRQLGSIFEQVFKDGVVNDMQIKTYHRELERYGMADIELIETHFWIDSEYITNLYEYQLSDIEKYNLSLHIFRTVFCSGIFDPSYLNSWLHKICRLFNDEHKLSGSEFKKLNRYISEYNPEPSTCGISQQHLDQLTGSFTHVLLRCPQQRRAALFTDLVHMHVNKLFSQFQRTHEMVIYNMVIRILQKPDNKLANPLSSVSDHAEAL